MKSEELQATLRHRFRELVRARWTFLIVSGLLGLHWVFKSLPNQNYPIHLGLSREGIAAGEYWQVFSYALLHENGWHLSLNAIFLIGIGARIEEILGSKWLFISLLSGVLLGGLCHLLLGDAKTILIGLSGGGLSLLVVLSTLSPQSKMMPLPISAKNLVRGIILSAAIATFISPTLKLPVLSEIGSYLVAQGYGAFFHISHSCHLGGCVSGWLIGQWLLRPPVSLAKLQKDRINRRSS